MQRQQDLYEKSKSTYDKASRGGLKVKEPPAPPVAKAGGPAAKAGASPTKAATTAAGMGVIA